MEIRTVKNQEIGYFTCIYMKCFITMSERAEMFTESVTLGDPWMWLKDHGLLSTGIPECRPRSYLIYTTKVAVVVVK